MKIDKLISVLVGFAILIVISSPFVWIWHSWYYAWRLWLSGIILFFLLIIVKLIRNKHIPELNKTDIDTNFQSKI